MYKCRPQYIKTFVLGCWDVTDVDYLEFMYCTQLGKIGQIKIFIFVLGKILNICLNEQLEMTQKIGDKIHKMKQIKMKQPSLIFLIQNRWQMVNSVKLK